jgi:hypothetical protein
LAIHQQFVAANQHVGIAARYETVDRPPGGVFELLWGRDAGEVAVRHHDRVRADLGLDAAQQ